LIRRAVHPTNPQTWNSYAYVTNNPTTYNDPLGLVMGLCNSPENRQCSTNDPSSVGVAGGVGGTWNPFGAMNIPIVQQVGYVGSTITDPSTGQVISVSYTPVYDQVGTGLDLLNSSPSANSSDPSWLGAFASNLFSWKNFTNEFKQGGCVNVFVNATAGALNPFSPSLSSAGDGTAAVLAASQYNAAVQYAASAPNYLGGTGLIYPMKSSTVRSMLADANATAASGALISFDLALVQGVATEGYNMATGGCH
jgi:hypothetical protein